MNTRSPRIIHGVSGPAGEPGVLLLVPPSEALDWDLRDEVASTARHWMADRQAWWVAAPYASTAVAIVSRLHGSAVDEETLPSGPDRGSPRGHGPRGWAQAVRKAFPGLFRRITGLLRRSRLRGRPNRV